jgi:nitrate reductase delta subunit
MAQLNQALHGAGVDTDGELPDHLIPILRYLDRNSQPPPALLDVLEPAIQGMRNTLHKAEPDNPYGHLFDAIWHASKQIGEAHKR